MKWEKDDYLISTDKSMLQLDWVHDVLSNKTYWCTDISKQLVQKAIDGSTCFGIYKNSNQVGFARVITDLATFAYLCDVFVDEKVRGQGLSKWLVECIQAYPDFKNFRRYCLVTKTAHGLYRQYGYKVTETPADWMEIKDPDVYKRLKTLTPQ